jgi:hypothetical protein
VASLLLMAGGRYLTPEFKEAPKKAVPIGQPKVPMEIMEQLLGSLGYVETKRP